MCPIETLQLISRLNRLEIMKPYNLLTGFTWNKDEVSFRGINFV